MLKSFLAALRCAAAGVALFWLSGQSVLALDAAAPHDTAQTNAETAPAGSGVLHLAASLAGESGSVRSGVEWRVFEDRADAAGTYRMVAQSADSQPAFVLPNGSYVVHATYGFASQMKHVTIADRPATERIQLNAGALRVTGLLGDAPIAPDKLSFSIYVPDRGNSEAKLVVANAKPGQVLRLPEGMYHVVSTYLDTVGVGSLVPVSTTNSVVNADLRIPAGKLVIATVKHRVAVLTLKLVNAPGGEALANTSFTILTPGGDVIRELIGAFPSLVLAEGTYIAIARHVGKSFQAEFKVESAVDRDVEIRAE